MSPTLLETLEVGAALRRGAARLREAGVEAPSRDAKLLLAEATGRDQSRLVAFPERSLSADELTAYEAFLARRTRREPVSRILGRREFWSLNFAVTADTLDPRPETEVLVEALLARLPGPAGRHRLWIRSIKRPCTSSGMDLGSIPLNTFNVFFVVLKTTQQLGPSLT